MELKPGYQQTEVGVIPVGWDQKNIGSFVTLKRGHDLTWRDRCDGDIPIMGSAGPNGFHNIALAKGPGVVLGRSGASFGQAHYCELDFWPHNTALYVTDFKGNHPLFVYYLFSSIDFSSHNSGGAQQSLNRNFIAPIGIGVPAPEEQRRLANALSDVDKLIGALEELISKKRNIKQATMQELLTGKRRLPGFEGEWETVAISQVAEKITGFWGRTEPGSEAMHSTSVIRAGDISEDGRLIGAARRYFSQHESSLAGCSSGDTVMTASGNGLGKSWTCDQDGVYSASNFVRIIRPQRGKADGYFLGYALKSRRARSKLVEHTATSAYPNLKPSFFNDKWLFLPPKPEQKAISDVLRDIDIEIIELEARKLKAAQLKQGMMQQLLTGKIRLT